MTAKKLQLVAILPIAIFLVAGFVSSASATLIVDDDFESGDFDAWTNIYGSPTVVSGVSHNGSYSAFSNSSGIHTVYFGPDGSEGWGAHIFARAYFKYDHSVVDWDNRGSIYITNWNGSDDMIANAGLAHWTGTDYVWTISCLNGASLSFFTGSSPFTLNTSQWYCLELETYISNSSGYAKLYVDGVNVLSIEGVDNDGQGNPNHAGFGQIFGSQDGEATWWDCCVIADSYIGLEQGPPFAVSISPSSAVMNVGQSQLFTSNISGGTSPYNYQWYFNDAPVSGATSNNWTFMPTFSGSHKIELTVQDAAANTASATTTIMVQESQPTPTPAPTSTPKPDPTPTATPTLTPNLSSPPSPTVSPSPTKLSLPTEIIYWITAVVVILSVFVALILKRRKAEFDDHQRHKKL